MKLTIGVPTFNRPVALAKTIDMLLQDSDLYAEIFEILVCDNGTNQLDFTTLNYPKFIIRHLVNEENLGLSGNIEKLILNARGEYIWLLSDDDIILEGSLRNLLYQIQNLSFDCGLLAYGDRNGTQINNLFEEDVVSIDPQLVYDSKWRDFIFISVALFKVDTAKEILKTIQKERIVNYTYPQLIFIFLFALKSCRFLLLNRIMVLDSQPNKMYRIENAFKVRIRDLILLLDQLKLLGLSQKDLRDLREYVKSSVINSLTSSIFDLSSKKNIRILMMLEVKEILKNRRLDKMSGYLVLFLGLQTFSLISIKFVRKAVDFLAGIFRKRLIEHRMWFEETHLKKGVGYHDYDKH